MAATRTVSATNATTVLAVAGGDRRGSDRGRHRWSHVTNTIGEELKKPPAVLRIKSPAGSWATSRNSAGSRTLLRSGSSSLSFLGMDPALFSDEGEARGQSEL